MWDLLAMCHQFSVFRIKWFSGSASAKICWNSFMLSSRTFELLHRRAQSNTVRSIDDICVNFVAEYANEADTHILHWLQTQVIGRLVLKVWKKLGFGPLSPTTYSCFLSHNLSGWCCWKCFALALDPIRFLLLCSCIYVLFLCSQ